MVDSPSKRRHAAFVGGVKGMGLEEAACTVCMEGGVKRIGLGEAACTVEWEGAELGEEACTVEW